MTKEETLFNSSIEPEMYRDIIVKLIRCITKDDKHKLRKIRIGMVNRRGLVASSKSLSNFAKYVEIDGADHVDKFIMTSVTVEKELLDKST